MAENKKVAVVFFSRTGENYAVGNIKKGNTHIIAEMIANETGGKLFRIEPVKAYPDDYDECTKLAQTEKSEKTRPAIKKDFPIEDYDIIYLGYPNWWGDMPMPVYTLIEKHKWDKKTIIPFCTHEGSGLSDTKLNIAKVCKGATVIDGLAIRGSVAQNSQDKALATVKSWLAKIKF